VRTQARIDNFDRFPTLERQRLAFALLKSLQGVASRSNAPQADVLMPPRSPSTTVTRFDLRHVVGPSNAITSWRMNSVVSNGGFSRTYRPTIREPLDLPRKVIFEFPHSVRSGIFPFAFICRLHWQ